MDERDQIIEELRAIVASQSETNKSQLETIEALNATIRELQETIRDLQRQLNQNSRNSSRPPSGDGFNKPSPKSQRTKSGKKPGGQKGHKGAGMSIPHDPDEVKKHIPQRCKTCPHLAQCTADGSVFTCGEVRYEVNAVITTTVIEHQSIKASNCPCGERNLVGSFPEGIRAYVQYGDSVTALVGLLSTYGAMSAMRIHTLMGSVLGVSLSTGTITAMVSRCASKAGNILEKIRKLLTGSDVVHFDETGTDVNGRTIWVHSSSTESLTYQTINQRRGQSGMEDNGVLPDFDGTAVHDCWSPYWKYDGATHAVCNAHLLRELTSVEEYIPEHTWATAFKTLLIAMKTTKEKAIAKGAEELSYYHLHKFSRQYDDIMQTADSECPEPPDPPEKKKGRKKKGKERSLIERLMALKDSVCLFIHDFRVPFDNNQAERDVRNVKTKTKVSGCFRTEDGAQDYLDIMSYLSTGRKHGVSVYDAMIAALSGNAEIVLQ